MQLSVALLVALGLCGSLAVAVPLDRSDFCAKACTPSTKWLYRPGTTYEYRYETQSETSMQGTSDSKAAVHIAADVLVQVLENGCEMALKLRKVRLEEVDPETGRRGASADQDDFCRQLESQPLRFVFQDGRIESICPSSQDDVRSLNIKKGILSMIQNSMEDLENNEQVQETDISGRCRTTYEASPKGWASLTIRRTKDLSSCSHRENTQTALQASPEQGLRSSPIVKGNQECKQTIKDGVLDSIECQETHLVRPFSRQENGAMTKIDQTLKLQSKTRVNILSSRYMSAGEDDLLYDHEEDVVDQRQAIADAQHALQEMSHTVQDQVHSTAPGKFTNLVYTLRRLNYDSLWRIFDTHRKELVSKKLLSDALPVLGSAAAVKIMAETLQRPGEVSDIITNMWLTSLSFVSRPTADMIKALTPLLNRDLSQAYLSISSLTHTYCKHHINCQSTPEIAELMRVLYNKIGNNCQKTDPRTALFVLKAIGNTGLSFTQEKVLQHCYENNQIDLEVRIAAIQAFRRFSCNIPRTDLVRLFENQKEEIETRIAAYLSFVQCADKNSVETVKNTLEKEKIKQFGSFVYSHIVNLVKYNTELKKVLWPIIKNTELKNRFDRDFRKFSKNFYYNLFFDPLDTGFQIDADIIHTADSYLPRSVKLNTTVEVFGKNINFMEIGARAEQLEKFLELWNPDRKSVV